MVISAFLFCGCPAAVKNTFPGMKTKKVSVNELSQWKLVGIGEVKIDSSENAVAFTEGKGSKAATLISPDSYGQELVVRFKVKPLRYEGVNVVFLSLSDNGHDIVFPLDFNDALDFYSKGSVQNYFVAFHNGYHNAVPFIKKNPGMSDIASAKSLEKGERWYEIETGRQGAKVWLKIDGITVASGNDTGNGIPGGRIGLRLRGPGDGSFASLYKDMSISYK
jgi:hypothetical protein